MSEKESYNLHYRIDPLVAYFFTGIILAAGSLLCFRFITYDPCPEVSFSVLGDKIYVKEMVKFQSYAIGGENYLWNFGDNTADSRDKSPVHIYNSPGIYIVSLIVNKKCEAIRKVEVLPEKKETPRIIIPKIAGPSRVYIGESANFTCTSGGNSWQWSMGESGNVDGRSKSITYKYSQAGYHTVSLIVDGNERYETQKRIYVRQRIRREPRPVVPNNTPREPVKPSE